MSVPLSLRGGDKNVSKKKKFRATQKEKLTADHAEPIKTTKLSLPSKKVDCPVTKKVNSFPEYKISADTNRQRTNASIKLRDILSNILKSCEEKKSENLSYLDNYSKSHVFLQVDKFFR